MLHIAIVEDSLTAATVLKNYLVQYQTEQDEIFEITHFKDGEEFLSNHCANYDIVFMDIEMPNMDGMKAAAHFRKLDGNACLIFVTNMAQFAIKGYEVDAMDFLLKPVSYPVFAYKMKKALAYVEKTQSKEVVLKAKGALIRLYTSDIYYIEVLGHQLLYHTAQGEVETWGTLAQAELEMAPHGFSRCNASYLVNMRYVDRVEENFAYLKTTRLEISRSKKKKFLQELTKFLGG